MFYKISGRVKSANGLPVGGVRVALEGRKLTSTTTDANGNYTFSELIAGGSFTVTPRTQINFSPANRSFNDLRRDESADFVGLVKLKETSALPPTPECSDFEKERIAANLIASNEAQWRRNIEHERSQIIAATFGPDVSNATATLGPIEFRPTVPTCSVAIITARYQWQVRADLPQGVKAVTVPRVTRFTCGKAFGGWFCR